MTKHTSDYSSRFRILKGGKISLVVSAMLMIGSNTYAATTVLSDTTTAIDDDVVTINSGKTLSVSASQASGNIDIYAIFSAGTANITNNGTLSVISTITAGGSSGSYSTATGVILDGSNGTVVNNGEIVVNAVANSAVIQADHVSATGIGISANATIENNNKITVRSSGFTSGIGGDSRTVAITSIINNGTIDVASTDNGATAIDLNSGTMSNNASVINNNILKSRGIDFADGIIAGNMQDNSRILNGTNGIIDLVATNLSEDTVGIGATAMSNFASITNNGTIAMTGQGAFNALGMGTTVMHDDSSITNNSTIAVTSNEGTAYGVGVLGAMNDSSKIFNNASISVTSNSTNADHSVGGIKVNVISGESSILNMGTILGNGSVDVLGIDIDTMSGNALVINEGTIKVVSTSSATGLWVGTLSENATILNKGTIESIASGYLTSIDVDTISGDASIVNQGTIKIIPPSGSADNTFGINVFMEQKGNALIENQGNIVGSAEYGIYTESMLDNARIVNSGNIIIERDGIYGSDGIHAERMEAGTSITNSGTIKATLDGALDTSASSIVVIDSSSVASDTPSITNTSTGKLYGSIYIKGDVTFDNSGLVSLPYNANATAEFQPTISNFMNTGTLEIGAKKTGGVIANSQLLTDNATFNNGSTMQVKVVAGSEAFQSGDRLTDVVTATNSLTINDLTVNSTITDTSALLSFTYETGTNAMGDKIDLVVSQDKTITDIVSSSGASGSLGVAQANIEAMSSVMSTFQALSTDAEIIQAVQSLTPTTATATVGAASQIATGIAGIVNQRQNVSGMNSGDEMMFGNKSLWVKTYGSTGNQNNKDGMNGFGVKSYGLGIGADGEYKANQKVGLAMFYTRAKVDVNNVNQKSNMDVISAIAYGSNLLQDDKTTFAYQLGYSWQKTSSDRQVFTGETATADYTSTTASLDMKLSRQYNVGSKWAIQPNVGATYRHFNNPSYNESGAGALNLQADSFSSTELLGNIGADVYYKLDNRSKVTANMNAGYNFRDTTSTVTSAFEGASSIKFASEGIDNGHWRYEAGLGYDARINEVSNVNLSYNYQSQGSDFTNNVISAKYEYKF